MAHVLFLRNISVCIAAAHLPIFSFLRTIPHFSANSFFIEQSGQVDSGDGVGMKDNLSGICKEEFSFITNFSIRMKT